MLQRRQAVRRGRRSFRESSFRECSLIIADYRGRIGSGGGRQDGNGAVLELPHIGRRAGPRMRAGVGPAAKALGVDDEELPFIPGKRDSRRRPAGGDVAEHPVCRRIDHRNRVDAGFSDKKPVGGQGQPAWHNAAQGAMLPVLVAGPGERRKRDLGLHARAVRREHGKGVSVCERDKKMAAAGDYG